MNAPKSHIAFALALCVLAGCSSGSGTVGGGVAQQDRATLHVSSVVLVRRWAQVSYPPPAPASGCPFRQSIRQLPDGTTVIDRTYTNCIQETRTQAAGPNQPVRIEYRFPDGTTEKATVINYPPTGNLLKVDVQHAYDNGSGVNYTVDIDTRGTFVTFTDDTYLWRGQILSRGQQPQEFTARRANMADQLDSTLRDGSRFRLRVPLRNAGTFQVPDYAKVAAGSYAVGDQQVSFELRGAGANVWNEWTLTVSDGVTGRFALNPDFSGSGQFFRNGQIDSTISWDRDGKASITLVSGEATTAGPSASALEFLAHAWRAMFAAGSPAPGSR